MAGNVELVDEIIDLSAVGKQIKFVLDGLEEIRKGVQTTGKVELSTKDGAANYTQTLKNVKELTVATQSYNKAVTDEANARLVTAKAAKAEADANKAAAAATAAANTEKDKAIKNALKEADAAAKAGNAYEQLKRQQLIAANTAKQLGAQYGANSQEFLDASNRANQLNEQLLKLERSVGQHQRNVGNYSGAISVLEKAFLDVRKKMDDFTQTGNKNDAMMAQLQKEYQLLDQLLQNQSAGFKSANAEIKENTKALQQMEAAGLESSAAYRELFNATAELKDATDDLKASIKNAAPDDVAFNAAADAAKGLIGIYGLAQSATAALGIENEQFQETLVKLQAAETALQSIEAIRAVFKKENAVRQAITIGLQKIELLQTNLQTAAESRSIIVRYAAIAAQKALNAAMTIGAGPMGIILGIIGLLVISIDALASSTDEAAVNFEKLNTQMKVSGEFMEADIDAIKNYTDEKVAALKAGFASEQEIREATKKGLEDDIAARQKWEDEHRDSYDKAIAFIKQYGHSTDKEVKKQLEEAGKTYDEFNARNKALLQAQSQLRVMTFDNQRQDSVDAANLRQDDLQQLLEDNKRRVDIYQSISQDTEKSLDVRLRAYDEYLKAQRNQFELARRQALSDPQLSASKRRVINNQFDNQEITLTKEVTDAKSKLLKEAAERDRKARVDVLQLSIEDSAKANEAIAADEQKSYEERAHASFKAYQGRKDALEIQRDEELRVENLSADERVAIEQKYASRINDLTAQMGKDQLDLIKANQAAITQAIEDENQKRANLVASKGLDAQYDINKAQIEGIKSASRAQREADQAAAQNRIEAAQESVRAEFAKVNAAKAGSKERIEAEKNWKEATVELQGAVLSKSKLDAEQRLEDIKTVADHAQEVLGVLADINNVGIEREKNKIQDQINDIDRKKEAEIAAINATAGAEEDKALRIQRVEATAAAKKEALQRRQKELEERAAKFAKMQSIATIIASTAEAVMAALGAKPYTPANIALAAGVGALGAAKLAAVIATPVAKYAKGTNDSGAAGFAVVGDGGRPEVIQTPDGKLSVTPSRDTLVHLPAHSRVFPSLEAAQQELGVDAFRGLPLADSVNQDMNRDLMRDQIKAIKGLEQTIKNKRENYFGGKFFRTKDGNTYTTYINKRVFE